VKKTLRSTQYHKYMATPTRFTGSRPSFGYILLLFLDFFPEHSKFCFQLLLLKHWHSTR